MSDVSVRRVREDLAVMRQALGNQLPFGPRQLRHSLILAAVGAAIAAITWLSGIAALPVNPGSGRNWMYGALIVVPVLLLLATGAADAYRQRATHPLSWREMRNGLLATIVAVPLTFGFIYWSGRHGQSIDTFVNAGVIFSGLFWLVGAVFDPRYRHLCGWGVATVLFGAVMPWGGYATAGILAGGWILLGGLATAGIMAWQLRQERAHGNDRL
jgi:hypothetical protein